MTGISGHTAFEIQEARRGWVRLVVRGELDISVALTFRRQLRSFKAAKTNVLIDLSQVEFIDSTGAHALNDALTDARQGSWRVEIAPQMSDQASRFFDLLTVAGVTSKL